MPYSARDLSRRAAQQLLCSNDPRVVAGAEKVEDLLVARGEVPERFDLATGIAIAGLVIKLAEFAYKIWSDNKAKSPASPPDLETALIAEAKRLAPDADVAIVREVNRVILVIVRQG